MGDFLVSNQTLKIQSYTGEYQAHFIEDALAHLNAAIPQEAHFIIDARIAELYKL